MDLSKYLKNFFNKHKFKKGVSWLAFWDSKTKLPDKVYIAPFSRLMNTVVGNYSRVKPGCVIKNAIIGKYCSIANDVMIGIGQHPTFLLSTNSVFYKPGLTDIFARSIDYNEEPQTIIGNDVWIGNGALVMDGVKIGDGAIIAARAVVTKDVPPYSIVGGVPSRILKYRFNFDVICELEKWQWWNLEESDILQILPLFTKRDILVDDLKYYQNLIKK